MLKSVLVEVKRIKTLMGVNESEFDVFDSNVLKGSDSCDYYENMDPPQGVDFWFQKSYLNLSPEEKKKKQTIIDSYVSETLKGVVNSYVTYYSSGDGYIKLKTNFIKDSDKQKQIDELLTYVKQTTYHIIWEKRLTPSQFYSVGSAWAFTQGNDVYINLYNFWDGTVGGKKSMYDTLKHEVGHVIQNYMLSRPQSFKSPYYNISDTLGSASNPPTDTILKDKEIHAYLQSFRDLFMIKPFDRGSEVIKKIEEKVNNGDLKWGLGELRVIDKYLCFLQKDSNGNYVNINANSPTTFSDILLYNLNINAKEKTTEEHFADTTYLFAKFVKFGIGSEIMVNKTLPKVSIGYVDINSIGTINYDFAKNTLKDSEEKFG